jgi:hypothetical protein
MQSLPTFTKRAAIQIKRLLAKFAKDLPPDTYMPCVGWEIGFEEAFVPRPILGLHEKALVPQSFQVECHGLKIAYNLPDSVMQMHGASVLDFDGKQFVFVEPSGARMGPTTEFLNVDLDLRVEDGLDDLLDALGSSVIVLQRTAHQLSLEMDQPFVSLEETILAWVALVEKLPPRARRLWDQCERRSFNIGIQAEMSPDQMCFEMSKHTIMLLAEIQAEFVITVYAPVGSLPGE